MEKSYNIPLISILVFWLLLITTDFWSNLSYQDSGIKGYLSNPLYLLFLLLILANQRRFGNWTIWDYLVLWIIASFFTCSIPAYFDFGQSFVSSFFCGFKTSSVFLFYYVLKVCNYPITKLMKVVSIFCLIWVFLELYQQITYPKFWFSGRYLRQGFIEERMGMMRFYLFGIDFVLFAFSYYLGCFIASLSKKARQIRLNRLSIYTMLFVLTVGIFCYLSRKHMAVAIVAFFMPTINLKGSWKWFYVFILSAIGIYLFNNYWENFNEMNSELMDQQGEGEDFVRVMAAIHYLTEFSQSTLYPFLGSGINDGVSGLSKAVDFSQEVMHLYQTDCGIIGYYSRYGLFGVSAILAFFIVFLKNWSQIDLWLKMFFVMKILLLFFDFWGMWLSGNAAFAMFVYAVQKDLSSKQLDLNRSKV